MTKIASNKPPIRISERDQQLLRKLSEYRLLSTEQIRFLLYPSISRARKRVLQLYRHGLLARFSRPVRLGEGSSQFLHRPSRKGESLINASSTPRKRRARVMSETQGEHALLINDFRIALELACKSKDDMSVEFWKVDRETKLIVPVIVRRRLENVPLVPDAYFGLRIQDRDFFYMLEIDRGTAPLSRIKAKLAAYLSFWQSKSLLSQLKVPTFRLLWITSGRQRLQNLLNVVKVMAAKYPRTDILFLMTQEQVRLNQPETILGKIWRIVAKSEVFQASPFPTIPFERSRSHQVNHQCANQKPELAKGEHGPGG